MNILLFSVLIVIFGQSVCGQTCSSAGLRKFDKNIAKFLTIGNSGRSFPENKGPQLKQYCDDSAELLLDMNGYKDKCLIKLPKQIASVLIYSAKNAMKQLCTRDSKRLTNIIDAMPCANHGNSEMNKCYSKFIDAELGIQNLLDDKKKIPHLCCEYFKLFPCFERRLKRMSKCDDRKVDTINDFIKSIVGNLIDLLCSDYVEGSDKCVKLGSPTKKRKDQRRTLSFALPMIEIVSSFPEV